MIDILANLVQIIGLFVIVFAEGCIEHPVLAALFTLGVIAEISFFAAFDR